MVGGAYLGVVCLGWAFQDSLIYEPGPTPPPADEVLPGAEEVVITVDDDLLLDAWLLPAANTTGPAPGILFLGGKGGNRALVAPLARALRAEGFTVLLLDYRGFGGNPGTPSEDGLVADADAGARYLASRQDVDPDRITYLGESLGAAVAIRLAVEVPPDSLILRSPFTSLHAVPAERFAWLPYTLVLRDDYPSIDRIGDVEAPVLVVASDTDELIPFEQSERIFDAAQGPKELLRIEGAAHVDRAFLDGEHYITGVTTFIEEHSSPD